MKRFLKWTVIAAGSTVGVIVALRWLNAARTQLEHGLERVERIAEEAQSAVAHTEEALGRTAQTARDIRHSIG